MNAEGMYNYVLIPVDWQGCPFGEIMNVYDLLSNAGGVAISMLNDGRNLQCVTIREKFGWEDCPLSREVLTIYNPCNDHMRLLNGYFGEKDHLRRVFFELPRMLPTDALTNRCKDLIPYFLDHEDEFIQAAMVHLTQHQLLISISDAPSVYGGYTSDAVRRALKCIFDEEMSNYMGESS